MNIFDNIIGYFSPEWGAKRAAWRQSLDEIRSYDAGSDHRLNAGWRVTNQPAEMTDRASRSIVRARARDLERNSDIGNAVLRAYRRNVIGNGWQLQAKTGTGSRNKEIEKLWQQWTKARNCDITEQQNLNQLLRMAIDRKKVDGGILIKKCYAEGGVVPFRLQMLEVDELDGMAGQPHTEGNRVIGGIELDKYNKPVGYWLRQYAPDGFSLASPVFVPAKDIIFYYTKRRPTQVREMSDMAPTLSRIRDVNEYMTAVSVKERINACLSVFIKKVLPVAGVGRAGTAAGNVGNHSYDGKTLTPGMISELNAGDEVQVVNPTGQAQDATQFLKMQERLIGAGQGISYEAASRDMSQSTYSSARQSEIEDELSYVEEVEQITAILDEIYETFIISAVLAGKLDFGARFWSQKDKYFEHDWIRSPKKWIDPLKEANANRTALETGQKTYKQIAAEAGKDWRQQIDDTSEVIEYAKDKGIDMRGVIFGVKANTEEAQPVTDPAQTGTGGDAAVSPQGAGSADGAGE